MILLLLGLMLHADVTVDFIDNKVVIISDNQAKVITVNQEDIDKGNVDKIVKKVKDQWQKN